MYLDDVIVFFVIDDPDNVLEDCFEIRFIVDGYFIKTFTRIS